jgi:hypothetical protein
LVARLKRGTAIAEMMPTITTTITSSMRLNAGMWRLVRNGARELNRQFRCRDVARMGFTPS